MYDEVGRARALQTKPNRNFEFNPQRFGGEKLPDTATLIVPAVKPTTNTQGDEKLIHDKLETARAELEIKGGLVYPPPQMDFSDFKFDATHTQGDKHPHDVVPKIRALVEVYENEVDKTSRKN